MRFIRLLTPCFVAMATLAPSGPASADASLLGAPVERVTILDSGGQKVSFGAAWISPDGGSFLFSTARGLVPGDTNNTSDLYLQDRTTGEIEWISVTASGGAPNAVPQWPDMSYDATHVVFQTTASNMVPGDTNGAFDVFVRDTVAGTTSLVSATPGGAPPAAGISSSATISNDGGHVAFLSSAPDLVPEDTNLYADVFVRDIAANKTERVSVISGGTQGLLNPEAPQISGNGRHVTFGAAFPYEVRDTNAPSRDVYVHDRVTSQTERVSVASDGSEGPLASFYPAISEDGRTVAFSSFNPNYVPYDTNGYSETFVRHMDTGRTERVVGPNGEQGNQVVGVPVISDDGRFLTANFLTSNYGYQDTNGSTDVYRIDLLTGHIDLASTTPDGTAGNAISFEPSMSADGRYIVFRSEATNLVPDGVGGGVFIRDLGPALGVGSMQAAEGSGGVEVTGWARLSSDPFLEVADPPNDAGPVAERLGAELLGAGAVYRPERGDLHLRLSLAPRRHPWPPLAGTDAPKPGAMSYGFVLDAGDKTFEVLAVHGPTGQTFSVQRCTTTCAHVTQAYGGIGTGSDDVRISVPLNEIELAEGTKLEGHAFAAAGDAIADAAVVLDQVALPGSPIPSLSVDLGVAESGAPGHAVAFDTPASVEGGSFRGTLPSPGSGRHEAWARVCLGDDCSLQSIEVAAAQ